MIVNSQLFALKHIVFFWIRMISYEAANVLERVILIYRTDYRSAISRTHDL